MKTSTAICSLIAALPTFCSLAQAFVYPASPVGATVWKPNTNVTISWSDDKQPPLLSTKPVFDIFLMTGSDDHQTKLATVATNVKGGVTSNVKYQVPYVAPPGQIYFLMFQTTDLKSIAWATRFTITDANGDPGNLHPVIPAGGKINPGGVGTIISQQQAQAETPLKVVVKPGVAPAVIPETGSSNATIPAAVGNNGGSAMKPASNNASDADTGKKLESTKKDATANVNVGLSTHQESNGNAKSARNSASATAAASSTAIVAFVGFAVLMGF